MEKGTRADCLNHRLRVGSLVNAASLHRTVAGGSEENTAPPGLTAPVGKLGILGFHLVPF